jgi:hypothetical protein
MSFTNTIFKILEEQNILRTSKTKPIVDAIKNRNKISFFYSGPKKPAKDSVKQGNRIDAEAVALGLSKRGNLVVRAYVQPPSVSKKGFDKTGWRTFMVSRMGNLKVSDEKFDQKRPDYKEGDDNSMTVTYVTTDWTSKPEVKKPRIIKPSTTKPTAPTTKPTPTEPEVTTPQEPKTTELPKPKPQSKPEKLVVPSKEEPKPSEPKSVEPTNQSQEKLPEPKPTEKPVANPEEDEENKNLQENIKNIKRLMFS